MAKKAIGQDLSGRGSGIRAVELILHTIGAEE